MGRKMEMAEGEDELLGDMLEVISFTEGVSAKLHRVLDEAKIYQVVKQEFAKSDRYTAGILLLDGDGASLKLAEISMVPSKLKVLERASGLEAKEFVIKLSKSGICRQVVREGKTVHANIGDIIGEFLPHPLAYLISKTMGYDKQASILTPLHKRGKVIGALVVSCTDSCEYLLHSVENLALHISTALELAGEYAQRKRAVQALKRYHDHLGELVEERTGELKAVNEKLREEITERKEAGEALRKIEREKLAILNSMSEIVVYQDAEHRIIWTNKAAAESVALSIEQLAGRHCYEIWPQSDKPCAGCPVAKARETGKPQKAEMNTPDGRVWFVRGYPVQDANKNLVGVVEVTLEITERKRAEEALRESEEKYKELAGSITDLFFAFDKDLRYTYWNKASEELTGISAKDALGKHLYDIFPDSEMTKSAERAYLKALKTQKVQSFVNEFRLGDKDYFFEISAYPSKDGLSVFAKDITERKRAEEALRESEEFGSSLLSNAPNPVLVINQDTSIRYVNPALYRLTGFSPAEIIGRKVPYPWWTEETLTKTTKDFKQAMRKGAVRLEELFQKKDGERFWVAITSAPVTTDGEFKYYLANWVDITERKRAEEALRESREKLQKMFESVTDGISVVDLNGVIIETNQRTVEMHGFASRDELLGRNALELVAPRDRKRIDRNMRKAIQEGIIRGVEYTLLKADGTEFPGELSTSVIRDASGRVAAHITIARDITKRKRAKEALRESEERFRSIVENSQAGIMILDDAYRFVYVNDKLCRISGYSHKEVIGQDFRKFLDEESQQLVAERYIQRQRGEEVPPRYEFNIVKKDGQKRRVEISSAVIKDSAGEVKTMAQILDITERKRAEEALQAEKNKLQSLIDAMEDGLTIQDKDFNIIYQNEPVRMRHGDHLGEKCYRIYEGREKVCDGCPVEKAFKDGKSRTSERRVVLPSGEVTFWEITASPVRDAGGRIVSCLEVPRNITERKQAEEALRESQQFSSSLLESSPNPILVVNPDTSIRYVNPAFEKLTGFTVAELEGRKAPHPWWPEEQIEEITAAFKKHVARGGRRSERNFQKKNGERFWVALDSAQVMHKGKPVYLIMNWLDITERKQAEEKLRLLSSVTQQISDATLVTDTDFNITYVNKAAQDLFGCSAEEMLGKHVDAFNVETPPESFKREVERTVSSGKVWVGTLVKKRKDGSTFLSECHISPLYDKQGQISSHVDVLRDITKRKQAEEALRESQKFSSSLLEGSPNPISVVDLDTSMRYVNPAFERLTGFTLAELAGRKAPYPWWPEGKRVRILAAFKDAIEHGGRRTERNFRNKNGERFWVTLNSAPVMHDGKPVYLIISWLDITERKQAEEKEKQLQQELYLAQRLASVGELAAGVAHEINNPLTGVLGFSQRLMRKSTDEKVSRDLEIIHSEARRAAEVVQSLLTFARRRQPKKEYANINDIVNKTLELRAYALQTGNIEVVTTLAPSLPQIMVDFPQMQEVFLNIILNAEQAMSEARGRGKLIITTKRLKKYVRISFADDGPGIAAENLDKLFDPFFTTRGERGGTGLGLSACHGIVTEHGGRIYARSKPGKGATFFVELPLSPTEAAVAR